MALEFRSHKDDAWYEATLLLEHSGARLRIKFVDFSGDYDELVNITDLKTLNDVEALSSRVRKMSPQLQDYECSDVNKGLLVCAAYSVADDRRFYDAVIDMVVKKKHKIVKGKEVCNCTYVAEWTSGPDVGFLTSLSVRNICRVLDQPNKVASKEDEEMRSSVLSSFLDRAKEKIEGSFSNSTTNSVEKGGYDSGSSGISKRFKTTSVRRMKKDTPYRRYLAAVASWSSKAPRQESAYSTKDLQQKRNQAEIIDNSSEGTGFDKDIEVVPHMLFVENLEKEISPVTIVQFLYQQASVLCKAFVMPSKPSELYTRGIIILGSKLDLEKLSNFLDSPDRIVVSSRGRPWIVPEKGLESLDDTLRATTQVSKLTSEKILEDRTSSSNELQVVISGSREYQKAKMLKQVIKEFLDHQCRLHNRLLCDEAKFSKKDMVTDLDGHRVRGRGRKKRRLNWKGLKRKTGAEKIIVFECRNGWYGKNCGTSVEGGVDLLMTQVLHSFCNLPVSNYMKELEEMKSFPRVCHPYTLPVK